MNEISTLEQDDRLRALDDFAGASSAPTGNLPAVSQNTSPMGTHPVGAQKVAVHRDDARILQKLKSLAAAAGEDWYYRFPVKNKGAVDYIEGPSIKLANDLARIYGNCIVDVRVADIGQFWLFYAIFIDLETGFQMTRPFQQRKDAAKIGGSDEGRKLDIALQIGASKAIRNVVVNALQTYSDFAFAEAKNSLVNKIGRQLPEYREKVVHRIAENGVDLSRVEAAIGKSNKDWIASDVARVIALMKGISDGMSTVDETFPSREETKKEDSKLDNFAGADHDEDGVVKEQATKAADEKIVRNMMADTSRDVSADPSDEEAVAARRLLKAKNTAAADKPAPKDSQTATAGPLADAGATVDAGAGNGSATVAPASTDPKTDAEYAGYCRTWLAAEQSDPEEPLARWSREKAMRNKANVTPETREALQTEMKARVADLKAAR